MRPPAPPELLSTAPRRRPWLGVITSVLIHGTLLSVVLWQGARPAFLLRPQADSVELAVRRARAVGMVYLPPPAPSTVDGRSRVRRPEPPTPVETPTATPPEQVAAQPAPKGDEGTLSEEDNVPAPAPVAEAPRRRNPSIAFRGGRPGSPLTQAAPSPAWQRSPSVASMTPRCQPGPPLSATDPIEWGVVAGRVFRLGTTDPLIGATLQVLGTPYSTTSNEQGDYVLRFDTWPLKNCEAQYVRVQLDGFVAQTLVLGIGTTGRSNVQLRGR